MTTKQNYDSTESAATPIEPTAQTPAQQQYSLARVWEQDFLSMLLENPQKREYLFALLHTVRELNESPDITPFISELISCFTANKDLNKYKLGIRDMFTYIALLSDLQSCFFCFDNDTDYVNSIDQLDEDGE